MIKGLGLPRSQVLLLQEYHHGAGDMEKNSIPTPSQMSKHCYTL